MNIFMRSDPRKDYFYEEFCRKNMFMKQRTRIQISHAQAKARSLRNNQARTRLGRYVATNLWPSSVAT